MMANSTLNQSITSPKDILGAELLSIQQSPMHSPLSDQSPLAREWTSASSSSTNSIRKSRLSSITNERQSNEKGSYSSLSSDKSNGSREDDSVVSGSSPYYLSGRVLAEQESTRTRTSTRSSRKGSLHHNMQKSRLAAATGGFQPSSPPFGGKRTLSRSRLQQQETNKSPCPPDGTSLPTVNSLLKSTSSLSSLSSLLPPAPLLSSTSSSNWGSSSSFRNEVMAITIAQRSSSKEVKAILTQLDEATEETASEDVVEAQSAMIARMALDAYYQVVISKYGGARIMCHVLKQFLHNASILESCCATLQRMPHAPYLQQCGIELLMSAMDYHPDSIHVQSAACATLAAILSNAAATPATTGAATVIDYDYSRLSDLVDRAAHMFLTPAGLKSIRILKNLLLERSKEESLLEKAGNESS